MVAAVVLAAACASSQSGPDDDDGEPDARTANQPRDAAGPSRLDSGTAGALQGGTSGAGQGGTSGSGGASLPLDAGATDTAAKLDTASASPDAASSDATTPPTTTCGDSTLLFCDDFESYAAGPAKSAKWSNDTANGGLEIDATKRPGSKTLHVRTTENGRARIKVLGFSPPNNSFFGRMRVFVEAFPSAPDWAHFTLVETAGQGAGVIRPIGGQYVPQTTKKALWGVGADGGPTGDWTNWKTSAPAEGGKWLCIEWELRGADNAIDVWIDGVAKPDLGVSTKKHGGEQVDFVFPKLDQIWFGWWLYQGGTKPTEFNLWYDDLALGTKRIGCG